MSPTELRELVRTSNPVPDPSVLLGDETAVRRLLEDAFRRAEDPRSSIYVINDVDGRRNMKTRDKENDREIDLEPAPLEPDKRWWPSIAVAVAAASAAFVLLIALRADANPSEDLQSAAVTTTESVAPTTSAEPTATVADFDADDARVIVDAYFEAARLWDFEAYAGLFVDPADVADDEFSFHWNRAQETVLGPPECTYGVRAPREGMQRVRCLVLNSDALVQAVDGPPVQLVILFDITAEGIERETTTFGQPDFNTVGRPFERWLGANHPDVVDKVGFGTWISVEEAEEEGRLLKHWAGEWAAYLEAEGCLYNEGC